MPLYRRDQSPYWWVRYSVGGVKVRRSTGTRDKAAAEEFESRLRSALWRQVKLGEKPRYTWKEAVSRWYTEAQTRGRDRDRERLAWFAPYLDGLPLDSVNREIIAKLSTLKATQSSPSTANRHLALLRMILRKAHREWEWTDKAPTVPMYRLERTEPRFLTRQQLKKLLTKLPPHLAILAEFSVETGARMRNVTHLQWEQVDLKRKVMVVSASSAKAGRTLSIPLNSNAVSILRSLKPKASGPVFTYRGKEIDDANGSTFKRAAVATGVPWLRWHDLRHTWASWHVQDGKPLHAIQEMGGWASYEMVRRYAHLNPSHLAQYAEHGKGTAPKAKRRKRA